MYDLSVLTDIIEFISFKGESLTPECAREAEYIKVKALPISDDEWEALKAVYLDFYYVLQHEQATGLYCLDCNENWKCLDKLEQSIKEFSDKVNTIL